MSKFKKWWRKQNNITLRMADPETIAKAAWGVAIDEAIRTITDNSDSGESLYLIGEIKE